MLKPPISSIIEVATESAAKWSFWCCMPPREGFLRCVFQVFVVFKGFITHTHTQVWSAPCGPRVATFNTAKTSLLIQPAYGILGFNNASMTPDRKVMGKEFLYLFSIYLIGVIVDEF